MIKCTECNIILKGRRKKVNPNKTFRCFDCNDVKQDSLSQLSKETIAAKSKMVVAKPNNIRKEPPKRLEPVESPIIVNAEIAPPSLITPVGENRNEPTVPRIELGEPKKKAGRPAKVKKNIEDNIS